MLQQLLLFLVLKPLDLALLFWLRIC